ncbi:DUF5615 family PIN-like protein [Athalassotoga saccharophila]|uniref:DUF5615 family PIN-like protein n=1 Tax=Athalassotoga saccharophila TaxID=1441386 RepID=UPI00137B8CF9|nr:DUF5615 family PIN-like protein [Athalassotoga saccharophila]BBJ27757.1 hypothetical protein ATHSA_0648 [Athalassotoga saccharophila]
MKPLELKFKFDENIPIKGIELFKNAGIDTLSVFDENLQGCSDEVISKICNKEKRILVTLDLDFSDIRQYQPGTHPGIIILRMNKQTIDRIILVLKKLLKVIEKEDPSQKIWIVDTKKIRSREMNN